MDKGKNLPEDFFDEKAAKYHEFAHSKGPKEVREKTKPIIDREIYGKVIDIGGGGELYYEIAKSDIFVSFDISYQQLKKMVTVGHVYSICGDAENFPFRNNIFEVAICGYFFHHLFENDIKHSDIFLKKILLGIYKILNQGGKIIIMENCLPKLLEKVENSVFPFFKSFLELFKQPPVRFLSGSTFCGLLREIGFNSIAVTRIPEKKNWQLVSLGIILPFLKIPQKLVATNNYVIIGTKP